MSTYLASRIRAIAADPTPAALAELEKLAVSVARQELTLDEIFRDAAEDERLMRSFTGRRMVPGRCILVSNRP